MEIRAYQDRDYREVISILQEGNVECPRDFGGIALVAIDQSKVIGIMSALTGGGRGYIDSLAIAPEYRGTTILQRLITAMDKELIRAGVSRYTFHVEGENIETLKILSRHGGSRGVTLLRPLHYFAREIA